MTKDQALRMAIEALNDSLTRFSTFNEMQHDAIQACKDALEQPAQEPMAWMNDEGFRLYPTNDSALPLYTHPEPSWQGLSDDEILNIAEQSGFEWHETRHGHKYLIAPAEAEMGDGYFAIETELNNMARAIEQALKEKNE